MDRINTPVVTVVLDGCGSVFTINCLYQLACSAINDGVNVEIHGSFAAGIEVESIAALFPVTVSLSQFGIKILLFCAQDFLSSTESEVFDLCGGDSEQQDAVRIPFAGKLFH